LRAVIQAPAVFIPDLVVGQATLMRERQFRRVDGIESLKAEYSRPPGEEDGEMVCIPKS
jgi:hypothetical protein